MICARTSLSSVKVTTPLCKLNRGPHLVADPVWLLLMFDIPVKTREQRRLARRYRNMLLDLGFNQVQFSVYAKYLINTTGLRSILPPVRDTVPPQGAVRMLKLTDEQWSTTYRFQGSRQIKVEGKPTQLGLFESLETDTKR